MISVSDVFSTFFSNFGTIFVFKRGLGLSPLVPVIGNLATFLFSFLARRAFLAFLSLFRLLRVILWAVDILHVLRLVSHQPPVLVSAPPFVSV